MTKILRNKSNIDLDYPICRPSLDLDFTQEVLDERITFSRGSTGTRVNRNRLIETVPANQPRFDYDPVTGECRGLLMEESRSNIRTNSQNITGSDYGFVSATLTQLTSTTPISTLTTVTRFFLNVGADAGNSQQGFNFGNISLTNSTVYTQSIFVKGNGSSTFRLRSNVTGQVFDIPIAGPAPAPTGTITACSVTPYSDGWSRISWTFTSTTSIPGNRADHWAIKTNIADGSSGFFVTGAQLEQGAFPTSYIPTGASTVTRSADNASMIGTNFFSWFNQTEGTLYASLNNITTRSSLSFDRLVAIVGTDANRNVISIYTQTAAGGGAQNKFLAGVSYSPDGSYVVDSITGVVSGAGPDRIGRTIISYKKDNIAFTVNGITPLLRSIKSEIPICNQLLIYGSARFQLAPSGYISRLTYYPRALKPNQLVALTQ